MSEFSVGSDSFYMDGKPVRILSGAMHYFRILPEYWRERLLKLKSAGLNTVETYVAWNFHEEHEGEFDFSGRRDVEQYIEIAGELGLNVIVRPSPYICAEWEFGGLPAWLLNNESISLRCADEYYLEKIAAYYKQLIPRLARMQCTNGGPIIMMQIENEYGSYGNDKEYLSFLKEQLLLNGINIPLFTSDGEGVIHLSGGTLPEVFKTINFFTTDPSDRFDNLKAVQPDKPIMCAEFWCGWFDHWCSEHKGRTNEEFRSGLEGLLKMGASVNLYMFHGGTNYGFMNGANCDTEYKPDVTSYDYDAILDEEGNPTEKYYIVRELIEKYVGKLESIEIPAPQEFRAYGEIILDKSAALMTQLDNLSDGVKKVTSIKPMEYFGQNYGCIVYKTTVSKLGRQQIRLKDVHDRAYVFVNGERVGIAWRNNNDVTIDADFYKNENALEIVVENMGRVNFGMQLKDFKGITEYVSVGGQRQSGWSVYNIGLDDISRVCFNSENCTQAPVFLNGEFRVDTPCDTYLRCDSLTKGQVWINGFNLGRYWMPQGPQKTLHIPSALLKTGSNEITVLEMEAVEKASVTLTNKRDLG